MSKLRLRELSDLLKYIYAVNDKAQVKINLYTPTPMLFP